MLLGVNIDHIAVLREARKVNLPDLLESIYILKNANADHITIHLREDRRHVNENDVKNIINHSVLPINLECSIDNSIIDIVKTYKPYKATLVPEKREELTTENGLNIVDLEKRVYSAFRILQEEDIEVSVFIDPNKESIECTRDLGIKHIELHTGKYANIYAMLYSNLRYTDYAIEELNSLNRKDLKNMLSDCIRELESAVVLANKYKIQIAAGHGLNYQNINNITAIGGISELNIGQSIIARSIFVGLEVAICEMLNIIR